MPIALDPSAPDAAPRSHVIRGRGATISPPNRFAASRIEALQIDVAAAPQDDDWPGPSLATEVLPERARTLITRNQSPDVPFDTSINPYRGCEHGCIYCYARPSHAYMDLSPGLDFERRLFFKADAARLLQEELGRPGYRCSPIAFGTNTDAYQPVEARLKVMRSLLEVLDDCDHPLTITTKGSLILRDIDLLADMARRQLVSVAVSVTTLDDQLKAILEPRTAAPRARLRMIRQLTEAGIPVTVLVAPVIPMINDHEMEDILAAAADAGASGAARILLRLPLEVADMFEAWLAEHYPDRANHVMSLVRQSRGGARYDPSFGVRMTGRGEYARLLGQRFDLALRRLGLAERENARLDCSQFRPPTQATQSPQMGLF